MGRGLITAFSHSCCTSFCQAGDLEDLSKPYQTPWTFLLKMLCNFLSQFGSDLHSLHWQLCPGFQWPQDYSLNPVLQMCYKNRPKYLLCTHYDDINQIFFIIVVSFKWVSCQGHESSRTMLLQTWRVLESMLNLKQMETITAEPDLYLRLQSGPMLCCAESKPKPSTNNQRKWNPPLVCVFNTEYM